MTLRLTDEQRLALSTHPPGQPIRVEGAESDRTFWLVASDDLPSLWEEYLRVEVQRGLECIDRGDIVEWNPDAIKERVRLAARNASKSR